VAAYDLGVAIASHVELKTRIEALMQRRISDHWTPWLVQLVQAVR